MGEIVSLPRHEFQPTEVLSIHTRILKYVLWHHINGKQDELLPIAARDIGLCRPVIDGRHRGLGLEILGIDYGKAFIPTSPEDLMSYDCVCAKPELIDCQNSLIRKAWNSRAVMGETLRNKYGVRTFNDFLKGFPVLQNASSIDAMLRDLEEQPSIKYPAQLGTIYNNNIYSLGIRFSKGL